MSDITDYQTTLKLIERDDKTTRDTKERQRAAVSEVLRFCTNRTDCRRTQILSFFNERFDATDCHRGCDICLLREKNLYQEEDVTADAKQVLLMMQAFDKNDRITKKNLIDCFTGKNGPAGKNLNHNPHFGSGKDWALGEADRLIQQIMLEGGLEEYYVANAAGWNNSYLQVCDFGESTEG